MNDKKSLGIYLHIPFCKSKCYYCDFYSFKPQNDTIITEYVDALISQIKSYANICDNYFIDSIYIGGGTPSILNKSLLEKLINTINSTFSPINNTEFTIEVNPATIEYNSLELIHNLGVNRISIGLQSANINELKTLGRTHSIKDFEETFNNARKVGFNNISVDLMFGTPTQTIDTLMKTLEYVVTISPEHISLYDLKIEPNTVFGKRISSLELPDEDEELLMYLSSIDFLNKSGYTQYEISNFSKDNLFSRHNYKYWNLDEYLGFGVAAHSFFKDCRFSYIKNVSKFISHFSSDNSIPIIDENEVITKNSLVGEYIMLKLRTTSGLSEKEFINKFGFSFVENIEEKINSFIKLGYMKNTNKTYSFTPKGIFVSNYLLTELLDFDENGNIFLLN